MKPTIEKATATIELEDLAFVRGAMWDAIVKVDCMLHPDEPNPCHAGLALPDWEVVDWRVETYLLHGEHRVTHDTMLKHNPIDKYAIDEAVKSYVENHEDHIFEAAAEDLARRTGRPTG